jgi:uncharacterized protein
MTSLPDHLPIFPLSQVLLLPRAKLPLNVFEPRYVNLVDDCLGTGRLMGIIQTVETEAKNPTPPLYQVGCMGRIQTFSETEDNRYLVTLHGLIRFRVKEELPIVNGYRRICPDFAPYLRDLGPEQTAEVDRTRLFSALRGYFRQHNINANWESIQQTSNDMLVTSLAMICPLAASEKQALLEAPNLLERAKFLLTLIEMAALHKRDDDQAKH